MELKKKIQLTNTQKRAQRKNAKKEQKKANEGEREEWKKVIVPCQQGKDIELHTHVVC